jgi:two-component system, cell cycle sensor histidine kinase and response regulator CckA
MSIRNSPPGVLIAEDEEELRVLLAMLFEQAGFTVFQAGDGQEALEQFGAHRAAIDVIVTDLGLPRLGGVEMVARVRALSPDVRILAASGFGKENVRKTVLDAGADEFMPKPFSGSALVDRVKELIGME